jgi:glycopeptide antibiotics resistance protein
MSRQTAVALLLGYLAVLAFLVFFPFGSGMDLGDGLNMRLWKTIHKAMELGSRSVSFRLMVGNILAFVPLGVLLPMALRVRNPFLTLATVAVGALTVSVLIEATQFLISQALGYSYRSTDIDDVVLNVSGALIGAVVLVVVQQTRRLAGIGSSESV